MLTERDHEQIQMLGRLQAANGIINGLHPDNKEIRSKVRQAAALIREAMLEQWNLTDKLLNGEEK